jgi:ribosomal protein S18 acetylase RimI-like enzyme
VRRAAGGYTKRANSVQSFDLADDGDAPARLAAAAAWFRARHIRPTFRVTPQAGPGVLAALDAAGWPEVERSHLFAMELGSVAAGAGELHDLLDPRFLAAQQALRGYDEAQLARLKAVLGAVDGPGRGVVVYAEGRPVASGLMVIGDGVVVTGNVVTAPGERRKGHAAAMMRAGLAWARAAGARLAALNVAADNPGAQALYRGLGYSRRYDYSYRIAGDR